MRGRMLDKIQFHLLSTAANSGQQGKQNSTAESNILAESESATQKELQNLGYLNEMGDATEAGKNALSPYRVDNAVILAAGSAARLAPLSFEKPKAMFKVRGEVLIERMIRQLKEAGIEDITIVVGYMKEAFFYLEEEFGVNIIVTPEYATRNNHASLYSAANLLGNTYVCNSDEYYTENIFSRYVYRPYLSACFAENAHGEYFLDADSENRIINISRDGGQRYFSRGPAYFDQAFSKQFLAIISDEYNKPATADKLWDDLLMDHINELEVYMKPYEPGIIYEFDYLTDLTAFDRDFFENVDSKILDNICTTLSCERADITDVKPVKAGLTNLSTLFTAKGVRYIYRHPGNGTEEIVNREAEAFALNAASELGLDDTFLFEDPAEGWKISRYIEGCSELDYSNKEQVAKALQMARTLHTSGMESPYSFDFYDEGMKITAILKNMSYPLPKDFDPLTARIGSIARKMKAEVSEPVLCHNDFYGPNFLVRGDEMRLIDWEYAAMGDPACDIGNFVAQGSGYTVEQTLDLLPLYYGRKATETEKRHCLGAVGLVGWYWYVWAMYKEAMGNPMGEWLYIWYKAAKRFSAAAEQLY